MRLLENFNFTTLATYSESLEALEGQLIDLIRKVSECSDPLTDADNKQFVSNVLWIKRFYEAAEKGVLDGNR